MRHKPSRKPSSVVYLLFRNDTSLTFFLISIKLDLEKKVIGFQFEPQRSISNHKGFFQDSSDESDATLAFGTNVGIASQWKQKRNVRALKKWTRFAVLIFSVYLS